jgi:uncharacterized membrane protein
MTDSKNASVSSTPTEVVEVCPEAVQAIMRVAASEFHQGPLPDAKSFASYNNTCPGAGDRILTMAEKQQAFQHTQENRNARLEFIGNILGQCLAAALLLLLILTARNIALNATMSGQLWVAGALVSAPVMLVIRHLMAVFRSR